MFLFFTFAVSIFFCGIVGVNISRNWSWDVINADTVYDTEEFREAFSRTLDRAVQADIYYQSEDRVSKGAAVDRNDLLNGFKRYYGIIDGIITGNTEINAAYDGLLLHGEIPESLQGNLEEYRNLVESRLPAYYKMYIQRQLDEYKNCIRYLAGVRNFLYYVEDENGNVVGGNAAKGEISQEARTLVLSAGFSSDHLGENPYYFDTYENPVLEKSNFKFYGAIRDPLLPGDEFYDLWQGFGFAKKSIPILSCVSAVSLLGMLLSVIYLVRVTGQTERRGKIQLGMVDRLYNEVHFLLVAFFGCIAGFTAHTLVDTIRQGAVLFWNYVFATILGVLYLVTAAILLNYLLSVAQYMDFRFHPQDERAFHRQHLPRLDGDCHALLCAGQLRHHGRNGDGTVLRLRGAGGSGRRGACVLQWALHVLVCARAAFLEGDYDFREGKRKGELFLSIRFE